MSHRAYIRSVAMAFKYEKAVPLGRSFDEYLRMLALSDDDLKSRIVGCGDGPASFNAEVVQPGVIRVGDRVKKRL